MSKVSLKLILTVMALRAILWLPTEVLCGWYRTHYDIFILTAWAEHQLQGKLLQV